MSHCKEKETIPFPGSDVMKPLPKRLCSAAGPAKHQLNGTHNCEKHENSMSGNHPVSDIFILHQINYCQ